MKILLLGFGKKDSSYEIKRLIKELTKRGHEVSYVYWKGLVFSFSKNGLSIKRVKGTDVKYYDYIIPRAPVSMGKKERKTRVYLSHLYRHYLLIVDYINEHHKHVLNEKTTANMPFYDKLFQHYLLAKNGLPVVTSLLYTGTQLPDSVYNKFKKPYIAKSIEGSRGMQVFLINNKKEIPKLVREFGSGKIMVQKYLPTNNDSRIIVIGNKVIGGMKRTAPEGDFRSNYATGGYVEKIKVSKEFGRLALKAAKVFNAEFAGVDIMDYKGTPYILEVNIFPMFAGFEEATKINVAEKLAAYIEKKYLWSIESSFSEKERIKILNELYEVEKENLEKPFTKKQLKEHLKKRDLIIVKKEQKPIAYLTHYKKEKARYVSRLVIVPKYRGQRIGRRMLRELIGIGKKSKDRKIQETVRSSNKKRIQSFLRAGFKKKKIKKDHFEKGIDGIVFEYKITKKKKVNGNGPTKVKK